MDDADSDRSLESSLRTRGRAVVAELRRRTAGSSRPVLVLAAVGVLVCLASIGFPLYALDAYSVSSQPLDGPPGPDDDGPAVVSFEDRSAQEQRIVEAAIEGEEPVLYAPYYAHQDADGPLPPLFSDRWIDDYEVGAVVEYEGAYYEVGTYGSVPFHFAVVIPAGLLLGLVLLAIARLSNRRGWRRVPSVAAAVGLLVLALLLWIANASGYLWPVQY